MDYPDTPAAIKVDDKTSNATGYSNNAEGLIDKQVRTSVNYHKLSERIRSSNANLKPDLKIPSFNKIQKQTFD